MLFTCVDFPFTPCTYLTSDRTSSSPSVVMVTTTTMAVTTTPLPPTMAVTTTTPPPPPPTMAITTTLLPTATTRTQLTARKAERTAGAMADVTRGASSRGTNSLLCLFSPFKFDTVLPGALHFTSFADGLMSLFSSHSIFCRLFFFLVLRLAVLV